MPSQPPPSQTPQGISRGVSLEQALKFWTRLGFISFGGPAGQIAIMHRELVDERRWISEARFLHALNYCMLLPGPEAQQLATYLGWLMHGRIGGILAGVLFILPSLVLLIALSWVYVSFGNLPIVAGVFYGIKPAVTAIVVQAAWRIGGRTLRNGWLVGIAVAAFFAISVLQLPFPAIIAAAAVIGVIGGAVKPRMFSAHRSHALPATAAPADTDQAPRQSSLIDDNTPIPANMQWRAGNAIVYALIGFAMWSSVMLSLMFVGGGASTLTQMGWFFTKAALLTFGGAYAVLPYVYQGAVETFQWLTPVQMIDGLALGETTPGPLIMVVAFVGYLGGVAREVVTGSPFLSGTVAALVVTFFTFLPSFIFILVGGPFIESTRGNLGLTAPLTAITAAVVGVIASLAIFFAWHVWWPRATAETIFAGGMDWLAVAMTLAAGIALMRYKLGVISVIALCGAAGAITTITRMT
ncbi:MAG: chromate efflux transporter [Rhodocyclaceae bacterium]|nr:chromate efflux transporter [Rhodocyclaceae bacterium]